MGPYPSVFPLRWPRYFWIDPRWTRPYRYEVRNAAGGLVSMLQWVRGGSIQQAINGFHTLKIELPLTEAAAVSGANEVWVKDSAGAMVGKFALVRKTERNADGLTMASCELWSYGAQLVREFITDYQATPGQHKTVSTILGELLALQVGRSPISLGTVDAAVGDQEMALELNRVTLMQALQEIEQALDLVSVFWVDDDRALQWRAVTADEDGLQLRAGRDAVAVERDIDASEQATRIYAYGKGDDLGGRLKLTDYPDWPTEYIESAMAGWNYKRQIVIDRQMVGIDPAANYAGVLTFPVHFELTADEDLAAYAMADGADLRFIDSTGAALPYQLISFTPETGAMEAWVQFTRLSAVLDTPFYLYFGNASATTASQAVAHDPAGKSAAWVETWDNNKTYGITRDDGGFALLGPTWSAPGIISKILSDERVTHAETLMRKAARALQDCEDPRVVYAVDAVDLYETSSATDAPRLALGATVRVIDMDLALDSEVVIASLKRQLDEPYRVGLQLAGMKRNLWDLIADVAEDAAEESIAGDEELPEYWPADQVSLDDGDPPENTLDDLLTDDNAFIDDDSVAMDDGTTLDAWKVPLTRVQVLPTEGTPDTVTAYKWQYPYDASDPSEKTEKIDARMIEGLPTPFTLGSLDHNMGWYRHLNAVNL